MSQPGRPQYRDDRRPPAAHAEVPAAWRAERARTVVVDGERFLVGPRPAEPGAYDFDWTTGPNAGYGFSISGWQGRPLLPAEIEDHIRDFLSGIDPESGYLD